jgi:hypothetical protein
MEGLVATVAMLEGVVAMGGLVAKVMVEELEVQGEMGDTVVDAGGMEEEVGMVDWAVVC